MTVVFVQRNGGGIIIGVFTAAQQGLAEEAIDDTSPAVVAFRSPPPDPNADVLRQLGGGAGALQFKLMFNHENRIRALESKAALTVPQYLAALKAML